VCCRLDCLEFCCLNSRNGSSLARFPFRHKGPVRSDRIASYMHPVAPSPSGKPPWSPHPASRAPSHSTETFSLWRSSALTCHRNAGPSNRVCRTSAYRPLSWHRRQLYACASPHTARRSLCPHETSTHTLTWCGMQRAPRQTRLKPADLMHEGLVSPRTAGGLHSRRIFRGRRCSPPCTMPCWPATVRLKFFDPGDHA